MKISTWFYLLSKGFPPTGALTDWVCVGGCFSATPPGRKQDGAAGRGLWNLGPAAPAGEKEGQSSPQPTTFLRG